MKFFTALTALAAGLVAANPVPADEDKSATLDKRASYVLGLDVDFTTGPGVPWSSIYTTYRFAYIQSTYGMTVTNPFWSTQKTDARNYKFYTGGVHHPNPAVATPSDQAKFFSLSGGGNWVNDGLTLPGALYLEANKHNTTVPYCYGLSPTAWPSWIKEFGGAYYSINGRYPVLFTSYNWWKQCTNAFSGFTGVFSMWVIDASGSGPLIPIPWTTWAFWQFANAGSWRVDYYSGTTATLSTCVSSTANC